MSPVFGQTSRAHIGARLENAYLEAHEFPSGRQLLLLFQFEKMVPAREEDLKTAKAIFDKYEELKSLRISKAKVFT